MSIQTRKVLKTIGNESARGRLPIVAQKHLTATAAGILSDG